MNTLDRLKVSLAEAGWKVTNMAGSWAASQLILDGLEDERYFVVVPRSSDCGRETANVGIHSTLNGHDVDVCVHMLAVDVMRLMQKTTEILLASWQVERMEVEDMLQPIG